MSTSLAKSTVNLTGIVNWLEWQDYIGSKLELATWTAIRSSDQTVLKIEPRKPLLADINSDI